LLPNPETPHEDRRQLAVGAVALLAAAAAARAESNELRISKGFGQPGS
jgi:hypothetical protein